MRSKLTPDGFWGLEIDFGVPGMGFGVPGMVFWGPGTSKNAIFEGPGGSKNVSGKGGF